MNDTVLGAENKKEQTINFISEAYEKLKEVLIVIFSMEEYASKY